MSAIIEYHWTNPTHQQINEKDIYIKRNHFSGFLDR